MAHTVSRGYPQVLLVRAKICKLWSDLLSTDGSFDASCRQESAWVTHEYFLKGVAGARRERFGRCWDLPVAALHVAGTSQETLWASLGHRRCRAGRRRGLAGNRVGVAVASQGPLGRRWGLAGTVLGVAGASQGPHWASLGLAGSSLGVVGASQGRS